MQKQKVHSITAPVTVSAEYSNTWRSVPYLAPRYFPMVARSALGASPPHAARAIPPAEGVGTQLGRATRMIAEVIEEEGDQQAGGRVMAPCDACGNPTIPGPG